MSEPDVVGWMAAGLISYETLPGGERRVRLADEAYERSPAQTTSMFVLDLGRGISDNEVAAFEQQLVRCRRLHELRGLRWTEIDPDALAACLAEQLARVVPDGVVVSADAGMLWVAGSGVDVAWLVSDDEQSLETRLILAAEDMLSKASDAISEITAEPWPAQAGSFAGGFPPYQAAVSNGELVMSYGDPNDPLLKLAPIKIDQVTRTDD